MRAPRRPSSFPREAQLCWEALGAQQLTGTLALGGGLGLLHYLDYRTTRDADAWWTDEATPPVRIAVLSTIEHALSALGEVRMKRWGEVVSLELRCAGKKTFSFQIAERSALLEPPVLLIEGGLLLDSLADLLASKMVALVERGAPRDFRDIHQFCAAGLTTPRECWELWERRQRAAGSDTDPRRARLAVETHLMRIELHHRLDQIADPAARATVGEVRHWLGGELLDALGG